MELVKSISENEGRLAPCPRLCGGKINLVGDPVLQQMGTDPRLKEPLHITGKELYQAVKGMGLPDEFPKDADAIELLLKKSPILGVEMEVVNNRIYLHELHFASGTVHLASGPRGAMVLKVTKLKKEA